MKPFRRHEASCEQLAERGFRSAKRCNETHAAQPIRTPGCSASPVAFGYGGQGWGDKEGKGKRKRIEEIS